MKLLWAPWRMKYILGEKDEGCIFCRLLDIEPSEENLLLYRTPSAMVLMNRYPYNNGHIMVAPNMHTADINGLAPDAYIELMELFRSSLKVLTKVLRPEGFNTGLNLGKSAGAGVEDHLHFHIVPRWQGDTNFMPVISETRVIPEALTATYRAFAPMFREL